MENITVDDLIPDMEKRMRYMKGYFPFSIVYGAINPKTLEVEVNSVMTKARPNNLQRKGWLVFTFESK